LSRGYPVSLQLAGRRVVVVGGGRVATRRVADLLEAGARVEVVAPEVSAEIEERGRRSALTISRRSFHPGDVDGAWIVFAATDDVEVNRAVVAASERARCFVSSAAEGDCSSLRPMSVLRRGDLEVAVGTSGKSPAVAAWLRRRLESEVGPEYGVLLDLVTEARQHRSATTMQSDGVDWQSALDSGILASIRAGRLHEAREGLQACLSSLSV